MKTVQEYLKSLEIETLINTYYDRIKNLCFNSESYKDMTIQEIEIYSKNKISDFIHKLQNLEIQKSDHEYMLLAYEGYFDSNTTESIFSLIRLDKLSSIKEGTDDEFNKIESYGYEFSPQAEIVGYKVSDNDYTQKNIYDLMADVLFESSFFGYEEDDKKEELNELKEAIEEVKEYEKEGKSLPSFDFEEWADGLGIYRPDEVEESISRRVTEAIIEYNKYSFIKEMRKIWNQMKKDGEVYE